MIARLFAAVLAFVSSGLVSSYSQAQSFTVTSSSHTGAGSLTEAITAANAWNGSGPFVINFDSSRTITLQGEIPIFNNARGVVINGNGAIIDGGSTSNTTGYRAFFFGVGRMEALHSPGLTETSASQWSVNNLTIRNTNARGGHASQLGGGGAGFGGGTFVNAGTLTLSNVNFSDNRAVGGNGGTGLGLNGSGGGMGGNAGGAHSTGGGGFGVNAHGGGPGGAGGVGNYTGGGPGASSTDHIQGGINGGGGGGAQAVPASPSSGGGGVGAVGMSGGFGGGGGTGNGPQFSGAGGYGGGGGQLKTGGFGGGFGGHPGTRRSGGGGWGAGGAIFVRQGASVVLDNTILQDNIVVGGEAGPPVFSNPRGLHGQALGSGLFLAGGASINVNAGQTQVLNDSIGGSTPIASTSTGVTGGTYAFRGRIDNRFRLITLNEPHTFRENQWVTLTGMSVPEYNGMYRVIAGIDANSFVIDANRIAQDATGGTITSQDGVTGGFTKIGDGTLVLNNVNNYSGGTTVSAGTLMFGFEGAKPAGDVTTVAAGATAGLVVGDAFGLPQWRTAELDSIFANGNAGFNVEAGGRIGLSPSFGDFTYGTDIGGNIALAKIGPNTLTLSGAISVSGGVEVDSGTLVLSGTTDNTGLGATVTDGTLVLSKTSGSGARAIGGGGLTIHGGTAQLGGTGGDQIWDGAGVTVNGGTFDLNGRNESINTLSGNGGTVTSGPSATLTVNEGNYGGSITGATSVVKASGGTLALSGNNSYNGGTNLAGGTLSLQSNNALGTGELTISGVGSTVNYADGISVNNSVNLQTDGTFNVGGTATQAGAIGGNFSVNKIGDGTLNLGGNSSYTGGTTLAGGGLGLQSNNALGSGGLTISGVGSNVTYADGVNINNAIDLQTGGTFNVNGGSATQAGAIGGSFGFNKIGDGTLALAGRNTFTGDTTVSAGTLALANNALASGGATLQSSTITVNSGATLRFDSSDNFGGHNTTSGPDIIVNGGTVTNSGNYINALQNLTLNSGRVFSSGEAGPFGAFSIRDTVTSTGQSVINFINNRLTLGQDGDTVFNVTSGQLVIPSNIADNFDGPGTLIKTGAGQLALTSFRNSTYTGGTVINGGAIVFNSDAALGIGGGVTLNNGTLLPFASFAMNRDITIETGQVGFFDTNGQSMTVNGVVSGNGGFIKQGEGVLRLTNHANSHSNNRIDQGTLAVSADSQLGAANGILFMAGGTLRTDGNFTSERSMIVQFNSTGNINTNGHDIHWNGAITEDQGTSGSLNKLGFGSLVLGGSSSISGTTTVSAGTLAVSGGASLASGNSVIAAGSGSTAMASVTGAGSVWTNTGNFTVGQAGSGTLNIGDGGRLVLGGDLFLGTDSTGSGTVNLSGGLLDMQGNSILGGAGSEAFNFTGGTLHNVDEFGFSLMQFGGTLAAGASPGILTIAGDYNLHSGGILEVELASAGIISGIDFDFYIVQQNAVLSGLLDVKGYNGFSATLGQSFDILTATSINATDLSITDGFSFGIFGGGRGQILRITAVPEPSAGLLAGAVLICLGYFRRRRTTDQLT